MAEEPVVLLVPSSVRILYKAVLGMCAVMRTHPDLSATQHMDLGFIHGQLVAAAESCGIVGGRPKTNLEDDL